VWAKAILGSNSIIGRGIAVDEQGNVYITGHLTGTADFDPGVGTFYLSNSTGVDHSDVFVLKLDSDGEFAWARAMGGDLTPLPLPLLKLQPPRNLIVAFLSFFHSKPVHLAGPRVPVAGSPAHCVA